MTTGDRTGETAEAPGRGRTVPDAEHYLDLSGVDDEEPGPHFDVALRGYDRRQVDDHVAGMRRMVAQLRAQLAVHERRRSSLDTAALTADTVRTTPAPTGGFDGPGSGAVPRARAADGDEDLGAFNERLRGILQAAEQEAQMVRNKAAETLLAEHAESRAALADLRTQRDAVVDELVRLRGWLDEIVSHPGRAPSGPYGPPAAHRIGSPPAAPWPGSPPGPPPGPPPMRPVAHRAPHQPGPVVATPVPEPVPDEPVPDERPPDERPPDGPESPDGHEASDRGSTGDQSSRTGSTSDESAAGRG